MYINFRKVADYVNLALGNSRRFNCRAKGYRTKISLSIMTFYMAVFTVGLFFGEMSTIQAIKIESVIGALSTILIASLGSHIMYHSWNKRVKDKLLTTTAIMIMGAQAAYIFDLVSPPIVNSLFQMAVIASMLVLYIYAQNKDQEA